MSTDRPDRHATGHDRRPTVTINEAAQRLGLSSDAVRSRLNRGTLDGEKVGNTWRVRLPDEEPPPANRSAPTDDRPSQPVGDRPDRDALVEQLYSENAYLREQLAGTIRQLEHERERSDVLMREALQRIEALTATVPSTDEAAQSPERDDADDQAQSHQHEEIRTPEGMWARLRRWIAGGT